MINNDVLRSIRYMLDLGDIKVVEIVKLFGADYLIEQVDVQAFLKRDVEDGYAECSDLLLAHFLDRQDFILPRCRDEA